jgi:RinA family phage transcriptional activator
MNLARMKYANVERANFRLIEMEIYNYEKNKAELEDMRANIIFAGSNNETGVSSGTSDTTGQKAMRIASDEHLNELEKRNNAIAFALSIYEKQPEKYRLVNEKYFNKKLTDQGIMNELHIESATFYRWRRQFIELIAYKLGWKV